MPQRDAHRITPTCPRCGYDQSGAVGTWAECCPIHGNCPECGTRFHWSDLYNPSRQDIPWMVEHARGMTDAGWRTPKMLARLVWPPGFWGGVGVLVRVRPLILLLWCLALSALLHLAIGVVLYQTQFSRTRLWYPPASGVTDAEIGADAAWVSLVGGVIETGVPYRGLRSFWANFLSVDVLGFSTPMWSVAILGFTLIWIIIMLVVPVTRRAAKLRVAHIARAGILSVFASVLVIELARCVMAAHLLWRGSLLLPAIGWSVRSASGLLFLWTVWWWRTAAKRGWSLGAAKGLVSLATLGGLLGAAVASILTNMNEVSWWMVRWF